jgi:putative peptide zinc metalloprotease protein
MSSPLFSSSWYRVANLCPRLRSHTEVHRHYYRGDLWYLIQDHFTGRFHRFTSETYVVIGLMDGSRTMDEIWDSACFRLEDNMPSQDEVIRLLGQLHQADIIQAQLPPDMVEVDDRRRKTRRKQFLARLKSPLAIKIPLWDPDRFLEKTRYIADMLFSISTGILWLILTITALVLAVLQWEVLSGNLADRVLALENLLLLWLVYPVVKGIHEFGHGYAVKRWRGEIHEMGVMLLVFIPVPYVDATAAYGFSNKYQRMLVGAAGIMTEVTLAAIAMIVWSLVEPGAIRATAFNVMLIAGVSTILFNGNPLLRFDAYYVLADFLEIPNLGARANRQLGYLLKKYLLGLTSEVPPARSRREAIWLVTYSLTSFCYRIVVMLGIALFVATKLFILGIILAIWSFYGFLGRPLFSTIHYLITDEQLKRKRQRLISVITVACGLVIAGLFWLPFPRITLTEGILWAPDNAQVVVATQGTVDELLVTSGQKVRSGEAIMRTKNSEHDTSVRIAESRLQELMARNRIAQSMAKNTESKLIEEEINRSEAELTRLLDEQARLLIRSPSEGVFYPSRADDLDGRFLQRGELVGYVLRPSEYRVWVIVDQADIKLVRADVREVEVLLAEDIDRVYPAEIIREVPGVHKELPSLALSTEGGGKFALDPKEIETPRSFEPFFQFEIYLHDVPANRIGERVYVRFIHSPEAIAYRWLRTARRALLERLLY